MIKKGITIGIIIIFLVGSFASGITVNLKESVQHSSRGTLYVGGSGPGNYSSIQSAINDASNGDTVFVYNGTYNENVVINKDGIQLIGENKDTTIIDANGTGNGIAIPIPSHYMTISNFTIRNANGSGINFCDPVSGRDVKHNKISNCIVRNSSSNVADWRSGNGIAILPHDGHIEYNTIINCETFGNDFNGIVIYSSAYGQTKDNQILNCEVYNNGFQGQWSTEKAGIAITGSNGYNRNTVISQCKVYNNAGDGLFKDRGTLASGTQITNNTFSENGEHGINISDGSNGDVIYHNNLVDNGQNAYDDGTNTWDNGYPSGGNYWSDFDEPNEGAWDNNSDGVGDTPYDILGGSNQDLYPLMYPWYPTHPDTVYVDDDYDNSTPDFGYDRFDRIQYGINEVPEGGIVYVYNGTYYENLGVDKTVNLIGEDKNTTIIDAGGSGDVVNISADFVNISGFTIQNSGGSSFDVGLHIESDYNTISDNRISSNNMDGIWLYFSNNNIISNNSISSNYDDALVLYDSSHNTISGNNISTNGDNGIIIYAPSNNNNISNNTIESNNDDGLYSDSFNNYIFHNNFIENLQNAYDEGNNFWDDGYPSGGNYWSDYNGTDDNGDGIGDTAYNISGGSNQDLYPLMNQWGENPPVANFTHSGNESPVLFDGSSSYDRDGIIVNWTWGFGDGTTGYGTFVSHSYSATGIYNVMLTVTDDDGYIDIIIKIIEIEVINQPPGIPFINGPKFGKPGTLYPYTLISVDPEDEDVYYEIDWGDGSTEPWDGPYESNTLVNKAHEWAERGIYIIRARAKDDHGTIGEWGTLLVTMPRNHVINTPFLNFLQNFFETHPNLFPIIQRLLQFL